MSRAQAPTRSEDVAKHEGAVATPAALELVTRLCETLRNEGVSYCHWKSNESLDRSATGENDLDLLVSRTDAAAFSRILHALAFKVATQPPRDHIPGIFHAFGLDRPSGRLVHVHGHYQLVVGDDMTKNYRLPIEEPYLASSVQGPLFRVPTPEFEFALFVVRMVLKHASWDAIACLQGSLTASERRELADLTTRARPDVVNAVLDQHLPTIDGPLWDRCLRAIQPGCPVWVKIGAGRSLHRALAAHARRPDRVDTPLKIWRRARKWGRRHLLRRGPERKGLADGGALVALVGGDGAGKSTGVMHLSSWLSSELATRTVHLGKPRRSAISATANGLWILAHGFRRPTESGESALAQSDGATLRGRALARMVWEVLTARDRYLAYVRARRFAARGGIAICDRFPLSQITLMDGAATARMMSSRSRSARYLANLEQRYYARIPYPDILIVMRVEPNLAVQRKQGEDEEPFVRPRSEEIWRLDWRETPAVVIDAGQPKADVLSDIRSLVWSRL